MKYITTFAAALLLAVVTAKANLTISQTFAGGTIPEGSLTPTRFDGTFSQPGFDSPVLFVTVNLNITGGYNGDLYAYLVSPSGTAVVLMNQPGTDSFGASGAGMVVTLTDGASDHGSIQTAGDGILTGSYNAAGSLAAFNGSQANGTWSLFFASTGSGGGAATLNDWSLVLTVVPEPVTLALGLFVAMIAALKTLDWAWKKKGNDTLKN